MAPHTPEYLCYSKYSLMKASGQMVAITVKASIIKVATSSSPTLVVFPLCLTAAFSLPLQVQSAETEQTWTSKAIQDFSGHHL